MTVQANLCWTWSEIPKTNFLETRLIYHTINCKLSGLRVRFRRGRLWVPTLATPYSLKPIWPVATLLCTLHYRASTGTGTCHAGDKLNKPNRPYLREHDYLLSILNLSIKMSQFNRKPTICICETKGADQLCSNCTADQRLWLCYYDNIISLLLKSQFSSF